MSQLEMSSNSDSENRCIKAKNKCENKKIHEKI